MTLGSRTRRTSAAFTVLMMVAMGGCNAIPVARIAPSPNRPQSTQVSVTRAALFPATVAMDPPSEMSSIEPVDTPAGSITLAEPPDEPSKPTPLLDAALERAKGLDDSISNRKAILASQPASTPAAPAHSDPASAPSQIQLPPVGSSKPPEVAATTTSNEARPRTPEPASEPVPARPEDLWREGVRRLASLARARLEQQSGGPGSVSPWSLRARILGWLAEPDIDPELGQHNSDGVRTVLRALEETSIESPRRGDEVRSAVLVLEDKAPLEIVDLRVCSKVDGFGDFEPFEPPVRKAGQAVILYCELDGLRFEQTSTGFRTRISGQFEILPEGGGPPILTRSLGTAEETCRRRRRDYYVVYRISLPKPLEPGDYRIRLTERDLTSDRSSTREVSFAIARD
jgi:hypothetical protein